MAGAARQAPGLRPLIAEHLRDNPKLLPHVLFGSVTEWARVAARSKNPQTLQELDRLLTYLDEGLDSDDRYVVNLIKDSFLENVQPPREYTELRERLMQLPRLRADYERCVGTGFW